MFGLIRHQDIDLAEALKGGGILYQNMSVGGLADTHHQRGRCSQAHGTGTGNDQNGNSRYYSLGQHAGTTDKQPRQERYDGKYADDGNEDKSGLVDDTLHRALEPSASCTILIM